MATVDTARYEAQLDALEEALFAFGSRLDTTREQAQSAAAELAKLQADKAAGKAVPDWQINMVRARAEPAGAEAQALGSRAEGLNQLLGSIKGLSQEMAARLMPRLRDLATLAGQVADAERKRATAVAEVEQLEKRVAAKVATGQLAGTLGGQLEAARAKLAPLDALAQQIGGRYEREAGGLSGDVTRQQEREGSFRAQVSQLAQGAAQVYEAPAQMGQTLTQGASAALSPASALTGTLGELGSMVGSFVGAFSPSTVMQFQMALADLTAVVGSALAPVMDALTTTARELGSVLLPFARQMQPIMTQLAQTVVQVLLPVLDNWGAVLQDMVPVFQFAADVFANVGTIARVAGAFMAGWIEQIQQWVSAIMPSTDAVKSFSDMIRDATQWLAKSVLLLVAQFAKLVGATGFLEGMTKSLGKAPGKPGLAKTEDDTGFAAAQQARFTTAMDFGKSVATAAFTATGGIEVPKDTNAWLQDVVKELEAIKGGTDGKVQAIMRAMEQIGADIAAIKTRVEKWINNPTTATKEALNSISFPPGFAKDVGSFLGGAGTFFFGWGAKK
jgi:hypothetical protein